MTRTQQRRAVAEGICKGIPGWTSKSAITSFIEAALRAAEVEQRRRDAAIARKSPYRDGFDCADDKAAREAIAEAIEADGEEA